MLIGLLLCGKGCQTLCFLAVLSLLFLSCGCTQQPQPAGSQTAPDAEAPAITVSQPDTSHIIITYPGRLDMDKLVELEISITDSKGRVKTESMGSRLATTPVQFGSSHEITGSFDGKDRVFITGYFSDGSQKPIIDTII